MNIRKLLLTALLFVPALLFAAQSWAATYTVTAGTSQQASSGTVSLAPPGGSDQTDKILIIIAGSSSTGATVSTSPSGYTRVDALGELAMFYKLGTGSEGSVNVGFSSGAIAAQIYSIESSTGGWDASPLAGFATRSPATGAEIPYSAMTAVDNGNLRFRVGVKRGNQTGITVSSVALTSGYTSGGFVSRDGLVGGLVLAAEWQEVAGNATDDDAVITTWSTVLNRDGITAEFIPASSGPTVTLSDATPDIDTTVTATLSGAFGAGGNPTLVTFASGDTVACSSATSTTCQFPLDFAELAASGDLGSTKVESATTLTVTNGTETSDSTAVNIQIPASGYAIVDLTCTAGTDCSDDSEAIVPMIAGDDCAIKVNTGSLNHLSTECAPVFNGGAFSYTVARYDESATAWLAQEEVSVTPPTSCRGIVGDIVFDIVQDILKEMQCVD